MLIRKVSVFLHATFHTLSRCNLFMKKICTILLLLTFSKAFSQETVEKRNRKTNEVYSVLKSNKSIKHGPYKKFMFRKKMGISGQFSDNKKDGEWKFYYWNGKLSKIGKFKSGVKDSIWTRYASDGEIIGQSEFLDGKENGDWKFYFSDTKNPRSIGKYENGQKVGVWEYYNKHGVLIHKFDHTSQNLIYYTSSEDTTEEQPNEVENDPENHKPMILGGNQGLNEHVKLEFEYPQEAQWNGVSGKVYVFFTVDENIQMKDFFVQDNPGYGIGEEAVRIVKTGPTWIPKKVYGSYENSKGRFPITFKLQ